MTVPDALTLLLADARLPVAGHTQSGGLEPGLAHGLTDVPAYLRLRLETVTRVEAATAVVSRAALLHESPLGPVVDAWAARTPSGAMRDTSRTMGKALLRLGRRLWPLPELPESAPRPVVLGALAFVCGLGPEQVARVVGYDDVQTVASAALKLMPLDPARATGWVVDALPAIEDLATSVSALTGPDQIPAAGAPLIEQYAESHATTTRRLFSA
jgi:urease accessory protein